MGKRNRNGQAKQDKRAGKVEKLTAKADLSRAKAQKRKWLFAILCAGIILYLLISKGGLSGIGGLLERFRAVVPGP